LEIKNNWIDYDGDLVLMKRWKSDATRTAYASDASIYAIRPFEIRQILTASDVATAVRDALKMNLPIIPRGGGTGLAGGAIGSGIILDFGKFSKIIEINPEQQTVTTQAGIIYNELNHALRKEGLFFPPDPSSGDSCQIGGMLANNSSGPHSVKYGLTSDHVEELEIVDRSGKSIHLKKLPLDSKELGLFFEANPDYEKIHNLLKEKSPAIKDNWPRLKKNSSGYNLLQVVNDLGRRIFNLPALMIGAEGTLGVILTAKLRLLPIRTESLTFRLYFQSVVGAGKAVAEIMNLKPSGLEIVDGSTLDLIGREKHEISSEAGALLLVEFDDNINYKKNQFEQLVRQFNLVAPADYATDGDSAEPLWKARRAIVPTLYRHHPTKRPIPLIEDISLPPDKIPAFLEYVTGLFDSFKLTYGIFGHIGDGNLHIRPLFDLNKPDELELAGKIYNTVYEKVISCGGSTTAEHADGRLRASIVKKVYGDEIYDVFIEIKRILDRDNIFSPGSVISEAPFTADIDFEKLKSYCAACGKCNGYCPANDIFRREDFSPRGWLRMINQSEASRTELSDFISFCLNCKNCTDICPAGVDIASDIIDFRSRRPSGMARLAANLADNELLLSLGLRMGRR
jgi:FAD/FMN-containing dehydrogenase/NAD-dependent dihydropyrimidine dehydrogenase PreA subunit